MGALKTFEERPRPAISLPRLSFLRGKAPPSPKFPCGGDLHRRDNCRVGSMEVKEESFGKDSVGKLLETWEERKARRARETRGIIEKTKPDRRKLASHKRGPEP